MNFKEENMKFVEELVKSDPKKLDERMTGTFKSKRLGRQLGKDEAFEIQLQALTYNEIINMREYVTNRDGSINQQRSVEANAKLCVEGIAFPDLHDEAIQKFCGKSSAEETAVRLFDTELLAISEKILALSNFGNEEETVKN